MPEIECLKPNTYKIRDEEANKALIHSINHVHPKHVWLILLQHKKIEKKEIRGAICWAKYFRVACATVSNTLVITLGDELWSLSASHSLLGGESSPFLLATRGCNLNLTLPIHTQTSRHLWRCPNLCTTVTPGISGALWGEGMWVNGFSIMCSMCTRTRNVYLQERKKKECIDA